MLIARVSLAFECITRKASFMHGTLTTRYMVGCAIVNMLLFKTVAVRGTFINASITHTACCLRQ